MPEIISIAINKRVKKCVVILDNNTAMDLSLDLVLLYKLAKGMVISDDLLKIIKDEQRIMDAKQAGYSYCAYKPRTEKQIVTRLSQKGFDRYEINIALKFLGEFNLINDSKYAKTFVLDFLKRKPSGKIRLIGELMKRGIAKDLAKETVDKVFPDDKNLDMAMTSANKKLKTISHRPTEKQIELLASHLQRQGFPYGIIKEVIKNIFC